MCSVARGGVEGPSGLSGGSILSGTAEQVDRGMYRLRVPADQLAARRVRRSLEALDYDFDPDVIDLLKIVATELVTNSVIHPRTNAQKDEVVVFVRVKEPTLLIKVCDRGDGVIGSPHLADVTSEGGRGLFLVDALTHSWGTSTVDIDGEPWACVWACFGEEALPCKDTAIQGSRR